ncbi:hypothetical protein NW768_002453 [Fusarium equiseti]|uniref:Uncharacterized protein n=1 Tax=Fusarium equiseti TaxID=61235 RepID=A0ABQ8RNX9_FUSEQ|nr:hypothetical protein NW768_002453 [Fusarium equiseti]
MATENATVEDVVGWQSGPKDRGTVTLIWGCVTTIFACSWTILHLNVPALNDFTWTKLLRKAKWMAITIVFPEFILSKAICDLRLALQELCEFDDYLRSKGDKLKWTTQYEMFGNVTKNEWNWRVQYPRHAKWLYRLFFLKPPRESDGKGPSPSNETEGEVVEMELNVLNNNEEEQEQEEGEGETYNPQNSTAGSDQNLEAQGGNPSSSDRGRETPSSNRTSRLSSRATGSPRPQRPFTLEKTTQAWTIVHSYFAQMGGLVYIDRWYTYTTTRSYLVLTASKLTLRYGWDESDPHPLQHLILGREDIEDKSKADSFVKSIAVLQIAWLVLNVIARAIKKLPITQIEMATIAFAVMAIFTYAMNWWKPKDVSRPIRLVSDYYGSSDLSDIQTVDLMQSFMTRLRRPHRAAQQSRDIPDIQRVPNDLVWMEGQIPLFYHLLGISSLGFGSLHCIAWNFQFPTRTELICWRVASLLSAALPGIALGLSMIVGYLRTDYLARKRIDLLLHKLQPLERVTEEWWNYLISPKFNQWNKEIQVAFMAMPKDPNTNWEAEPPQEIVESLKTSEEGINRSQFHSILSTELLRFHNIWQHRHSKEAHDLEFEELWRLVCDWTENYYGVHSDEHDFREFWRAYESFLEEKLRIPPQDRFETSCVDTILKAYEEVNPKVERLESRFDLAMKIVEGLNVCSGIIYIACRLITIVLLFTCLRAAPSGVYQVVQWTIYIPGIS